MKRTRIEMAVLSVAAAVTTQFAAAQDAPKSTANEPASQPITAQSQNDVLFSKMRDETVKSASGQDLGKLDDVLINPRTGKFEFAVLGRGGFFGIDEKLVPVPWQKVTASSNKELTVNVDAQQLRGAPRLEKDYSNLTSPGFIAQVHHFYAQPSATGAGETPGSTGTGTGQQTTPSK
jgi:sporulation protein YlmC with PRC-barrel domain